MGRNREGESTSLAMTLEVLVPFQHCGRGDRKELSVDR
jgi:hypothetical protein